ncbi:MAG: hypothetical protein KJZ83_00155 [Burkholderiaceae bacterium]|nr:hypothetical protein [Burkholderiaceae bacterium]
MHTETTKMIYPQEGIANQIANKLMQTKDTKYAVYKVTTGFQVVPVTICKSGMPPAIPAPVAKVAKDVQAEDTVTLEFPFNRQTKSWWYFDGGEVQFLHKSHPISVEIKDNMLRMVLAKKTAIKFGLLKG